MTDTMSAAPALRKLLDDYAQPDPKTISTLPKGNTKLDFVGHAEITRILIQVDPLWEWEPAGWDPEGGPLVIKRGDELTMWGWLTIHGKRLPCVGTCAATKHDADKELIGDLLRNGAMRFGIALNLWSKAEKAEADYQPEPSDFLGWPNQGEHDAWWKVQSGRLKALNDAARDLAIGKLIETGLFAVRDGKRVPILPFDVVQRVDVEAVINGAEKLTAPLVAHSQHAIDIMADALDCDPLNPPEGTVIEPWMWDLAEVEDLDAHDWKTTTRAAKVRQADLVDRAFHVAERPGLPTPDGLNDIHGPVAAELRMSLLKGETF